jgi:Tfp pilus assembly protein PilF
MVDKGYDAAGIAFASSTGLHRANPAVTMNDWQDPQDAAEKHARKAEGFFKAGQWSDALRELRQALRKDPDRPDFIVGMGMALEALGRSRAARKAYRKATVAPELTTPTLLGLSAGLLRVQDAELAVETLNRAIAQDRDNPLPYALLIPAFQQLGDTDQAELMFHHAVMLDDKHAPAYAYLADLLAQNGELDRAIWCWRKTAELAADFPGAYVNLARLLWRKGQTQRAREHYEKHIRQFPQDLQARMELGGLLAAMNQHAEAATLFRDVLEQNPDVAPAHRALGELSLLQGHLDAAEKRFRKAAELQPDQPGVYLGLARVHLQRGQLGEAHDAVSLELNNPDPSGRLALALARMLIELRRPAEAVDVLNPWLEFSEPTDDRPAPQPSEELDADSLLDPPADAEAAALANADAPLREQSPAIAADALICRGVGLLQTTRMDRGIADLRGALRFRPDHPLALFNLAIASMERKQFRRAAVWLRRARSHRPDDKDLRKLSRKLRWRWLKHIAKTRLGRT